MIRWIGHLAVMVALALAGVAPGQLAQDYDTVDLLATPSDTGVMLRVHGYSGTGRLGVPVAGGHDCDGDGHMDAAVGYFTASPNGRTQAGETFLFFGDGATSGVFDCASPAPRLLRIIGDGVNETCGHEVWMDDVTGDNLGDVLIGRQNYSVPGRIGVGAVTILVGGLELREMAEAGTVIDLRDPPSSATLFTIHGRAQYDRFGMWFRTADATGDGIDDLLVGADQADEAGAPSVNFNNGEAWLFRGGPKFATSGTLDLSDFGASDFEGDVLRVLPPNLSRNYHFGATVQLGDLDGNGRAEVIVAAALNRSGGTINPDGAPIGTAQGSGGAPDGTTYILWDENYAGAWPAGFTIPFADATTKTAINGHSFNISFGEEILAGSDYDGDGKPDLYVGDIIGDGTSGSRRNSGTGHVFYDASRLKGLTFDLESPPDGIEPTLILGPIPQALGSDTMVEGDFDGDGLTDLGIGSPHASPLGRNEAGAIHVLFGQQGGWPALIDTAPGASNPGVERIVEIQGALGDSPSDNGDVLCYSGHAADMNCDGVPDIIVNEMTGNGLAPNALDVGNLIIISGRLIAPKPYDGPAPHWRVH